VSLDRFVPLLVREAWANDDAPDTTPRVDPRHGALLFADISGFSTLMERSSRRGPAKVEAFGVALNTYLDLLIQRVRAGGGDVVNIAGDAVMALWADAPGASVERAAIRATQCALSIQEGLHRYDLGGGIRLSLRIAVTCGTADLIELGAEGDRRFILVVGDVTDQTGPTLSEADPGEVLVSGACHRGIARVAVGDPGPHGTYRVRALQERVQTEPLPTPAVSWRATERILQVVPHAVKAWHEAGVEKFVAERREISTAFVAIPDINRDAPGWLDRLQRSVSSIDRSVARYDGDVREVVVDDKGCVVVAHWGLPTMAQENGAARAVRAAREVHDALAQDGLSASIGLSTGSVFCGVIGNETTGRFTSYGAKINLAARLMGHARGALLCDRDTRDAASDSGDFASRGTIQAKGFPHPVEIFSPGGMSEALAPQEEIPDPPMTRWPPQGRLNQPDATLLFRIAELHRMEAGDDPTSELVGREAEVGTFGRFLARLTSERDGGVLVVEGEPGLGKTALVGECRRRALRSGVRVLNGFGNPIERRAPYHACRALISELFELPQPLETALSRRRVLAQLDEGPEYRDLAPLLNDILPLRFDESDVTGRMSQRARADNLNALVARLVGREASAHPIVVFVEDAHWFDSASWSLLRVLIDVTRGVLFVLTTRPLVDPAPAEYNAMLARDGATKLTLEGVPREVIVELVKRSLDVAFVPAELGDLIAEQAEGNPLFGQELALALRDTGVIEVEKRTCYVGKDLRKVDLPTSIQGVVATRVDELPALDQLLLKVASVVGRSFGLRLLCGALPGGASDPKEIADRLASLDVVRRLPGEPPQYEFTHGLTSQAIYDAMLLGQRRELHEAVVGWYESNYEADDLEASYPLLAHHATCAENWPRAVHYLALAGSQALERAANGECLRYYVAVLDITRRERVTSDPQTLGAWRWNMAEAAYLLGDMDACIDHGFRCLAHWGSPMPRGTLRVALELARVVTRRLVAGRRTPSIDANANETNERILALYGRLADALAYAFRALEMVLATVRGLELSELASNPGRGAQTWIMLYLTLVQILPRRSIGRFVDRALALSERERDPRLRSLVVGRIAIARYYEARWDEAAQLGRLSVSLAETAGDPRQLGEILVGYAHASRASGRFVEQYDELRRALDLVSITSDEQLISWVKIGSAESLLWRGSVARASSVIEEVSGWIDTRALAAEYIWGQGVRAKIAYEREDAKGAMRLADETLRRLEHERFRVGWMYGGIVAITDVYLDSWTDHQETDPNRAKEFARLATRAVRRLRWFARVHPFARVECLYYRGRTSWQAGDERRAIRLWQDALELSVETRMRFVEARCQLALAAASDSLYETDQIRIKAEQLLEGLGIQPGPDEIGMIAGRWAAGRL
jgi:class 3 adenylate cyclase